MVSLDTFTIFSNDDIYLQAPFSCRAVICRKQISVEGNGHCCHRPSSNWETNQLLHSRHNQCCHSKKIENPRLANKKTKKTQGQISIRFRKIPGKNRTFPEKAKLFLKKMSFYPSKFLMTFF